MSDQSAQSWIKDAPEDEPRDIWQARITAIREPDGFYENLGDTHSALFVRRGQTLIVSFETRTDVYRHGENRLPFGLGKDQPTDWSVLGVMAHAATWYRDDAVYDFFDRLHRDGFFEQFDQVVFFGISMGAYAACAFSRAAPGCTVICISPQATLDRDIAPWESRFRPGWRQNFSAAYGYAPDMIARADKVFLFYDPTMALDAMHAVLFQGANLSKFKCRFMGAQIGAIWQAMQIHDEVVERAIDHDLPAPVFYRLMRKRHDYSPYQKEILARLREQEKHELLVRYCRAVLTRRRAPTFRHEMNAALKILGRDE